VFKKTAVLFVSILVTTGLAGQKVVTYKITGNVPSVNFYSGGSDYWSWWYTSADINPTQAADGTPAYYIGWHLYRSSYDGSYSSYAETGGLVPMSAVKAHGNDSLTVDLDLWSLSQGAWSYAYECSWGYCWSFTPTSFPLKGTFTRYSVPGSSEERYTGTYQMQYTWSQDTGQTEVLKGSRTRYSAKFAGTVGSITVTPPEYGVNGNFTISTGQHTISQFHPSKP
jgi:hypothetical protein